MGWNGASRLKLAEHGVEKIVPSKQTPDEAYQLFERSHLLEEAYDQAEGRAED